MKQVSPLKLQKQLFTRKPIHTDQTKTITNQYYIHKIIRQNYNLIRDMSEHCKTSNKIAKRLHVPRHYISQYKRYHHIHCKPKHIYFQERMGQILPYIRRYHYLSIVSRKLDLPYSSLYAAYTEYKRKNDKGITKSQHIAMSIYKRVKHDRVEMDRLKEERNDYKERYQSVRAQYNELVNLLNQYIK